MKKINLLGKSEEKVIYPLTRTSGRIFSILIFWTISLAILFFIYNLTPTSRRDVAITNNEMLKNKIDTSSVKPESSANCDANEYQAEFEKLKVNIPDGEWTKLTDTVQVFDGYEYTTQYDPWYGSYQTYAPKYRNDIVKNRSAIPNQLINLYENKGIDSTEECEKIEILKVLNKSCEITKQDLRLDAFHYLLNLFYQSDKITSEHVENAQIVWKKTHPGMNYLEEWQHITSYGRILNSIAVQKPTKEKIDLIAKLIDENEKMTYSKKKEDQAEYEEIPSLILDNQIPQEDLSLATDDFIKELNFHTQHGFVNSAKKYYRLYQEKWEIFESEKKNKEGKKEELRLYSAAIVGGGILALLLLSIVLLLFSINKNLTSRE